MAPRKPIKKTVTQDFRTKKQQEGKNDGFFTKSKRFLIDERTRFIAAMFIAFAVVYFAFAFLSYFFTGAADQSKLDLPLRELLGARSGIQNWTSVVGAYVAEAIIGGGFGLSSFAILFFLAFVPFRLMRKELPVSMWKVFFCAAFWLIWLSVFLSFTTAPLLENKLFFSLGGEHGDFVSDWLVSFIGLPGTLLLLLGTLLLFAILSSKKTIPFLRAVFAKLKRKNKSEALLVDWEKEYGSQDEEDEASVAVGTEIVPEDWIVARSYDEAVDLPAGDAGDISFEVQASDAGQLQPETSKETPDMEVEVFEEEDPYYNLEKLGRYDPTLDLSSYKFPVFDLLKVYSSDRDTHIDMAEQNANKNRIITTLQNYGIEIESIKATVGPTITLYEIVPKAGVRISKIRNLEYDIMLSLAATGIRIIAPIPGKGTIGIEVPNSDPQVVSMHSVISSKKFQESKLDLPVAFGRTITNEVFMIDLAKMPHLLVAGATGQGKSVGLNAIITSLLYKKHPSELKLVLVDPKKVEFNIYGDIEKHFLAKLPDGEDAIITDTSKVVETLNSLCKEMDDRYDLLKKAHTRNIKEYNEKFFNRQLNPEKGHRFLPYIVVIVDEFGDLIMTAGKEVEMPIARIAQLARAVGIHMIIATQRPSVNIITGVIKANFPARVAFRVSSMIDSRTILDAPGANQLVGRGDMLFSQGNDLIRVQCAFVDTPEVERIVHYISGQQGYPTAFYLPEYVGSEGEGIDAASVDLSKRDPMFEEAARLIVANQQGSTSLIQRKFSIGYNRAGRLMDQLEVAGIVGPAQGSKARDVYVIDDYHLEQILKNL